MSDTEPAFRSLAEALDEAIRLHGADWSRVKAHLDERRSALDPKAREHFDEEMRRALAFRPHRPTEVH